MSTNGRRFRPGHQIRVEHGDKRYRLWKNMRGGRPDRGSLFTITGMDRTHEVCEHDRGGGSSKGTNEPGILPYVLVVVDDPEDFLDIELGEGWQQASL